MFRPTPGFKRQLLKPLFSRRKRYFYIHSIRHRGVLKRLGPFATYNYIIKIIHIHANWNSCKRMSLLQSPCPVNGGDPKECGIPSFSDPPTSDLTDGGHDLATLTLCRGGVTDTVNCVPEMRWPNAAAHAYSLFCMPRTARFLAHHPKTVQLKDVRVEHVYVVFASPLTSIQLTPGEMWWTPNCCSNCPIVETVVVCLFANRAVM